MFAAKISKWCAIHYERFGQPQLLYKQIASIRTSDSVHSIKQELEIWTRRKQLFDQVKVENLLHEQRVLRNRIDDFNLQVSKSLLANL